MFEESTTEQLKRDIARVIDDVASLRRELRQTGQSSLAAWRDEANDAWATARRDAKLKAERVDRYVHEQPWVSATIAAAIGAFIVALLSRGGRGR